MRRLALLLVLAAIAACKAEPPAPSAENTGGAAAPKPPEPPKPVPVKVEAIGADQQRLELSTEAPTEGVPATVQLVVRSEQALTDVRIRLFDEGDKLVPSDDRLEVGQGTTYTLKPQEPLEPSSTYRLRIDASRGEKPVDVAGKTYEPRDLKFRTHAENGAEAAGGNGPGGSGPGGTGG